jgi:hypothetical protein
MTYFEFMVDRVEAAKIVRPSQCGWGMFLTLATLGPTYSALYTEIGLHPGGFWDRVSDPDSNIPKINSQAKALGIERPIFATGKPSPISTPSFTS